MLENQGLNQHGSQLEQTFCLDDKDNIPPSPHAHTPPKKKIASKIKKQKKSYAKVKVPYSVTKVKVRDFNPFFWIVNLTMKMIMKCF